MQRQVYRWIFIVSTIVASWLGMQAIHELGHVIGALVSGGIVDRVVLHPLTISRTDLSHNSQPILVVWAGPILGCLLPLLLWQIARWCHWSLSFLLRFFAGFCLLANGLYIGIGSFDRVGDCGEMLRHGSPIWVLWIFGAASTPVGLWLWHGQGPQFGWGGEAIAPGALRTSLFAAIGLLTAGLLVGGR